MNLQSRVEKVEAKARLKAEGVRVVVRVPPKMSREEWRWYARARRARPAEALRFTLDIDNAGVMGGGEG